MLKLEWEISYRTEESEGELELHWTIEKDICSQNLGNIVQERKIGRGIGIALE